jgi:hypothetical protein
MTTRMRQSAAMVGLSRPDLANIGEGSSPADTLANALDLALTHKNLVKRRSFGAALFNFRVPAMGNKRT